MKINQKLIDKIDYIDKHLLDAVLFGIVYLVWNYTTFIRLGGVQGLFDGGFSTLDASWVIGLNWASQLNMNWAADNLVFTFGPLYYLDGYLLPEFHRYRTLILVHVGMNLLFASCYAYVFSFFRSIHFDVKNKWLTFIVAVLLLAQKPTISLLPLLVAFICLPIFFHGDENFTKYNRFTTYGRYGFIALILAAIPFIKFSHIYESILFMAVLVVFLAYEGKYLHATILGSFFIFFSIAIWLLVSGEGISSYLPYMATRFIVSSGYTEAMMMAFRSKIYSQVFVLALLYFAGLGLALLYLLFTRKINWIAAWLLPLVTLFLGFKNSFVRADGHSYIILGYVFLSVLYYYYMMECNRSEKMELPWLNALSRTFVPFLAIIVFSSYSFLGGNFEVKNDFLDVQTLLRAGLNLRSESQYLSKQAIKTNYGLEPEFVSQINPQEKIDIIPWDIAFLYGYDLKWTPRPVIQSYASYTSELDAMDAQFFRQSDAPEQLVISTFTIDQRYILFDTPATFKTLMDNYEYISRSKNDLFALFRKRPYPLDRDFIFIQEAEYSFSEKIAIPREKQGYVFMFAEVEPTLLGKVLNVLYKPTTLFVELTLANGDHRAHRIISNIPNNGLFVSRYVENLDDLQSVFSETADQNITSVRLLGNAWLYKEPVTVRFYKIPFLK